MFNLGFISTEIKAGIAVIVLSSCLTASYFWHKSEVKIAVSKAEIALIAKYKKQSDLLEAKSKKASSKLKDQQQKSDKEKDAKVKQLDTELDAFVAGLLNRPERPEVTSSNTRDSSNAESTKGATGAELYRSDAEVLARYATKAEQLKIELLACYKQYDEVKQVLDKFRKDNPSK